MIEQLRRQLTAFPEVATFRVSYLEEGTREHTITAFWEYLLLLEVCHKVLENDRLRHLHDHTLREQYQALESIYRNDPYIAEGDFAERLLSITNAIEETFYSCKNRGGDSFFLNRERVTELLYKHDLPTLRCHVVEYLPVAFRGGPSVNSGALGLVCQHGFGGGGFQSGLSLVVAVGCGLTVSRGGAWATRQMDSYSKSEAWIMIIRLSVVSPCPWKAAT